jgi:tRNA pseudouridine38-40 synthase
VIVFTMRANAFLHHMVRNLVGSLIYVGSGRKSRLAGPGAGNPRPPRGRADLHARRPVPGQIDYDPKWALPLETTSALPWF